MKKILTILLVCLTVLCLAYCGAKQSESKTEASNSNDSLQFTSFGVSYRTPQSGSKAESAGMNDSIQGTFFGASFGVSKDEVIDAFAAHDLVLIESASSEDTLSFYSGVRDQLVFGGMLWRCVDAMMTKGKFSRIKFYQFNKDKAEAIEDGEFILKLVSQKYNLMKEEPKDTTTPMRYVGISKKEPNREVSVVPYKFKYEGKVIYGVSLIYDEKIRK